ncbi:54S ribosomal protein L23, mitochondrial [Toensbergia leucococca]|nr:54S ribosomal protein L23, mitochondrial [Toensbergia leucococca]
MSQTIGRTRLAYTRTWHHVSLSAPTTPPLGRLASRIAVLLMGKHKPTWDPSTDCGDYVVATGCTDVFVTGKKMQQKQYYKRSTRPGSLKVLNMEGMVRKWGGGECLRRAVRGMLPKDRLREPRLGRLKVFEGAAHPYKENLMKVDGKTRIAELPQVRTEMLEARSI